MAENNDFPSVAKMSADTSAATNAGNQAIQAEGAKVASVVALLKSVQGQPAPDLTEAIGTLQGVKTNLDAITSNASTGEAQTELNRGPHEKRAVWGT